MLDPAARCRCMHSDSASLQAEAAGQGAELQTKPASLLTDNKPHNNTCWHHLKGYKP